MTCIFVQVRCTPGQTYAVAEAIADQDIHSELYSTSGEFDLLVKLYVPEGLDVGRFVNDKLATLGGIDRTLTTLTFKAF
ncbi:MAG: Lrp/AsnC ligand binding domain-containing protein [Granulosicoccus sp.]